MEYPNKKPARLLHGIFAGFVLLMLVLGFVMTQSEYNPQYYYWHKSLGVIFSVFVGLRLYSHKWHKNEHCENWEKRIATCVHRALLALLLIMPVTGLMSSGFSGYGLHLFDWILVPVNINEAGEYQAYNTHVYQWAKTAHHYLAYGFSGLIGLHILAAVKQRAK